MINAIQKYSVFIVSTALGCLIFANANANANAQFHGRYDGRDTRYADHGWNHHKFFWGWHRNHNFDTLDEYRTIDGSGNNLANPEWGKQGVQLLRDMPAAYTDGVSGMAGPDRPSPRVISNIVSAQTASIPNSGNASDYLWQWGQWIDHDFGLTEGHAGAEPAPIPVPAGDPYFDPDNTGSQVLAFDRSVYDTSTGIGTDNPRQQTNALTSWIDASNVYGSTEERTSALRANDGTGRLLTSAGNLLPFNTMGLPNAGGTDAGLFVAGDIRANEQVALTAMHTLWVREHNRLADEIANEDSELTGDEIFEEARARVGALQQAITYNTFLPLLLGENTLDPYRGYNPGVNATLRNTFSAGIFRVGHTMLGDTILRLDANGNPIDQGNLPLRNAFFNIQPLLNHGVEPLLRGLTAQRSQAVDPFVVDGVRNFLFGEPGQGGLDLVSMNIQRGRDHGLESYNATRVAYGLPARTSFDQISSNPVVRQRLAQAYSTVDDIDLWVGAVSEDTVPGALVGETLQVVMKEQFEALRDGDRFWYENVFHGKELKKLNKTTLADIIIRNTSINKGEIPDNVFMASPSSSDVTCTLDSPNVWHNGFFLKRIQVTNNSNATIHSWSVDLNFDNPVGLIFIWNANGNLSGGGTTLTAKSLSYNDTLAPGQTTTWGMLGSHNGSFTSPTCTGN